MDRPGPVRTFSTALGQGVEGDLFMNKQIPSHKYLVHSWTRFVQVSLSALACSIAAFIHAAEPSKGLIDLFSDLSINVASSPPTAVVSNELTYTLTVSNAGPQDASGVVLIDTLPVG